MQSNLVIGFVYIVPGLLKRHDPLQHLREGNNRTDIDTPFIVMGDINARIGNSKPCHAGQSFRYVEYLFKIFVRDGNNVI